MYEMSITETQIMLFWCYVGVKDVHNVLVIFPAIVTTVNIVKNTLLQKGIKHDNTNPLKS